MKIITCTWVNVLEQFMNSDKKWHLGTGFIYIYHNEVKL